MCLVGLIATAPLLHAEPITINFERLLNGDVVTSQFPGLVFSNAMVLTAGIDLNEVEFPPHSGENVVFDNSTSSLTGVAGGSLLSTVGTSVRFTANAAVTK